MKTCPACWSIHIERSRRKPFEHILSRFGIYPFTCHECGHRFRSRLTTTPISDSSQPRADAPIPPRHSV
jgi:hypothetical protein